MYLFSPLLLLGPGLLSVVISGEYVHIVGSLPRSDVENLEVDSEVCSTSFLFRRDDVGGT